MEYVEPTGSLSLLWLLIALPLAGAAVLLLAGRFANAWGHLLGCATVGIAFVLGVVQFFALRGADDGAREVSQHLFTFIDVGGLKVDAGLLYDPLSAVFVLLITGVGFLIHVYSIGYMSHDEGRRRFFGFLNLFVAAMLLLVLGNSFVALYVGWEGVGLASYLLIAFWYTRPEAATAAKKAFIMNRVGDVGLALGIFLLFAKLGDTSFEGVFSSVDKLSSTTVTILALLLLLGACGKSGQFPLQAWLPDAMAGPTPVSALIHAATMVTAGVYLIARAHPIYDLSETGQTVVCVIGALTLLIGCIIGCAKDDIKKVLAYSTVSQIGYMFLAVGLGGEAYALGIIHLLAHGFFKAGLFLGAGSVMHGMNDQVDIRRFGGLAKYMPITATTFGLGFLAIIGIPPLSGFFSKDPIIEHAFDRPGWSGWLFGTVALVGAGLTAFYMTRLFVLTFLGKPRWTTDEEGGAPHPHESPLSMTVPMILLAIGSVAGGFLLTQGDRTSNWLHPVLVGEGAEAPEAAHKLEPVVISGLVILVVLIGVALAFLIFRRGTARAEQPANQLVVAARRNLYADAFNEAVFMRPGQWLTRALVYVDSRGVDGLVNGLSAAVGGGSGRLRRLQTGFVRSYALTMLGGAVVVLASLLVVRLG
ncbi:NADH-quinone oxidoreductase subunit L [Cryptosporangium phraense]|uniref:NADH-quinone oxidoreductase subunit L n=1 Tax=Cryptosporangium phraense TaxID=2593070 RepID=A0A545AUB9_9ACTN|nr:NADH-quinone oxidoreductase subunit L [Cryptosporangium phraense]TQS44924.1 NADH-quinone oxidoreductase subunit L [Cryptosporangium phraense]